MDDSENSHSNHGDDKGGKGPPWRRAQRGNRLRASA
jgi:hypothetical protein